MIQFIGNVQNRQIHRDRQQISACLVLSMGTGLQCFQALWKFWELQKCLKFSYGDGCMHLLKIITLYP